MQSASAKIKSSRNDFGTGEMRSFVNVLNVNNSRKNLIVVRAGENSLHPEWISEPSLRNFDIFVSYYGKSPGTFSSNADYYEAAAGLKYPALFALCQSKPDLLFEYDACWFPDDDLSASTITISRMFDLFHKYKLWLAQPALKPGSYFTYPGVIRNPNTKLRFTGFVEIMCPIFQRDVLETLVHTFSLTASGWGLDLLWQHLLGYPDDRIAVLDQTPVVHTRPVGGGVFYKNCAKMGVFPQSDLERIVNDFKLEWRQDIPIYGSVS